jgi:hypothetical protein
MGENEGVDERLDLSVRVFRELYRCPRVLELYHDLWRQIQGVH